MVGYISIQRNWERDTWTMSFEKSSKSQVSSIVKSIICEELRQGAFYSCIIGIEALTLSPKCSRKKQRRISISYVYVTFSQAF